MQKKFAALILIALAGALLLSGCPAKKPVQEPPKQSPQEIPPPPPEGQNQPQPVANVSAIGAQMDACLSDPNKAKADSCLIELGKQAKSDEPCEKIAVVSKDKCFFDIATAINGANTCGKVYDFSMKAQCLAAIAKALNKTEICKQIIANQPIKDSCILETARQNLTLDECASIFDPGVRDNCYISIAQAKQDSAYCDRVSDRKTPEGFARDVCYKKSQPLLKAGQCLSLVDSTAMVNCFKDANTDFDRDVDCSQTTDENSLYSCRRFSAIANHDVSACYKLSKDDVDNCITRIISGTAKEGECAMIRNYVSRNDCYRDIALTTPNTDACGKIEGDAASRDKCFADAAGVSGNPEVCSGIKANNISGKDACFYSVALSKQEYAACEKIQTDAKYVECFSEIALTFTSPDVCNESERKRLRLLPYAGKEYCFEQYALKVNDPKVCDKISLSSPRQECKDRVALLKVCVNGDGVCDERCDFRNDSDCKSPFYCASTAECNDYRVSTIDECVNNSCKHTPITKCVGGDNYCPQICTFVGNKNALIIDQTTKQTNEDSDCLQSCAEKGGFVCPDEKACTGTVIQNAREGSSCCSSPGSCQ